MVLRKVLTVGGLLLNPANACSCLYWEVCDQAQDADVIVHATAVNRSIPEDVFGSVTFIVDVQNVYKGDTGGSTSLSVSTCIYSACCGVDLTLDEEYVLGLYGDGDGDGEFSASSCGLVRYWSEEIEATLEACEDPCNGTCVEPEECVLYDEEEGYTCAFQSCDPNPCPEGDTCTILESFPPIVTCSPECSITCGEFQECLIYTDGSGVEEPYCADVCAPGRCEEDETCSLLDVTCVQNPCPPVAECTGGGDGYEYVGCFKDQKEDRVLTHKFVSTSMTTDMCAAHCKEQGSAYMGTQYGRECWCDVRGTTTYWRHGGEEDGAVCDTPCGGNEDETCGGSWTFSFHKLDWPAAPTDNSEYVDCYRDNKYFRVMTDKTTSDAMDPTVCRDHCLDRDALYYGTQYSTECWCGYSDDISDYTQYGEGACFLSCSGDESIACGGYDAFGLFKIEPNTA